MVTTSGFSGTPILKRRSIARSSHSNILKVTPTPCLKHDKTAHVIIRLPYAVVEYSHSTPDTD